MNIRSYILYQIFFFIILSCTSNDKEEKKIDNEEVIKKEKSKGQDLSFEKKELTENNDFEEEKLDVLIDSITLIDLNILHTKFNKAPYFFEKESQRYYYVVNGSWEQPKEERFKTGRFLMGITDSNYKLILPVEYDKIFSPDVLKINWVEIQKNEKIGLFNYKTGTIIPCQYDYFFLSMQNYYVAYGVVGNELFGISESGDTKKLESKISYKDFVGTWSYDVTNNYKSLLIDTYLQVNSEYQELGKGLSFTPSFFNKLNVFPEVITGFISNEVEDIGTYTSNSMITKNKEVKNGVTAFLTRFYRYGASAREDELERYNLVTKDEFEYNIDVVELGSVSEKLYNYCDYTLDLEFVNDSIIAVKSLQKFNTEITKYRLMTYYNLFEVLPNGKILKLESDRFFDFTKYLVIDEYYFTGCYSVHLDSVGASDPNVLIYKHLSVEDLDIMRNEIYAEYGYKFKSERWKNYFKSKSWYSEIYDNVDDQLTETDKENIKLILNIKEKLIKNPEFVTVTKKQWYSAG